jgi:hypothetical protein
MKIGAKLTSLKLNSASKSSSFLFPIAKSRSQFEKKDQFNIFIKMII